MDQTDEIIAMFDGGITQVTAIATELGLTPNKVRLALHQSGRTPRRVTVLDVLGEEKIDGICADYAQGNLSTAEIIEKYAIDYNTFYKVLKYREVPLKKTLKEEGGDDAMDMAITMYYDNYTLAEILQDTGIHQPRLHAEIRKRRLGLRGYPTELERDIDPEIAALKEKKRAEKREEFLRLAAQRRAERKAARLAKRETP